MEKPTTTRETIRQILAASKDPLTRIEIYAQCKDVADEATLSTVLSQLCVAGDIKKVGELERIGGRALALYAIANGAKKKAPDKAAKAPKVKKGAKRGPYKKRAVKTRALALRKVQPPAATSPDAPGFRCGIFSDGSMDLERAGETFQMNEAEVRAMFHYLERTLVRKPS